QSWIDGEHQADDARHVRARHAGAGHRDPFVLGVEAVRSDDVRPGGGDVRLRPAVARRTLAARDVDRASSLVEVGDAEDALAAAERAHRRVVDVRAGGEEGRESPHLPLPEGTEASRIVPLDPPVEAAVPDLAAVDAHDPGPRRDADDALL